MGNLYNMLFGRNSLTPLLLATVELAETDIERFRNVAIEGNEIIVFTRTGGGNREDYPQKIITSSPYYVDDYDDEFDSTYASFIMRIPEEFVEDANNISRFFEVGMRKEFVHHLSKTLFREPTELDKEQAKIDAERRLLKDTKHFKANGHTFVPLDDKAMKTALEIAEANGGELRTLWGILPLKINVSINAKCKFNGVVRVKTDYEWKIDDAYWNHCVNVFSKDFPITMERIGKSVEKRKEQEQGE